MLVETIFGKVDVSDEEHNDLKLMAKKQQEYITHFHSCVGTENLCMSAEEFAENVDLCIKENKEWYGFIEPPYDDNCDY